MENEKERKWDRADTTGRVIRFAAAAAVVMGIIGTAVYVHDQNRHEKQFEELRASACILPVPELPEMPEMPEPETAETETEDGTESAETEKSSYDFDVLRGTNEDIYAWITVPGTQTDYPILQSETDDYYLDHNLDHTTGYPGCIYTNRCSSQDFSDELTVLYGHNMKDGSMFGDLHEFEEADFFEEHREILIETEEERLTYEIVAATTFSDMYLPAFYQVTSETDRDRFLADIKKYAESDTKAHLREHEAGGKYVILSTCVKGKDELRYLVVGRLMEQPAT